MADKVDQEPFKDAMKRWDTLSPGRDDRELAVEDIIFATQAGAMSSDRIKTQFRDQGKPLFEINRILPAVQALVGEFRQLDITTKFRPAGGGARAP